MRILAILALASLALFCVYGFLAATEPGEGHRAWRIGYALVGALAALAALVLTARRPPSN